MQGAVDRLSAAREILAFWEAAGVDVGEARAALNAAARRAAASDSAPPTAPTSSRVEGSPPKRAAAGQPGASGKLAQLARSPSDLRAALEEIDGGPLKRAARKLVFTDGPLDAPVMVIGERPGADEDAAGVPYVGPAGRLLDAMLRSIGLSRAENALITNVVFWRPPGDRPPTQSEIALCSPFCERLIDLVQPKVVLVMGSLGAQALLKREDGAIRARGKRLVLPGPLSGVNAMVTLDPAYLLKRPQDKALAWADLLALDAWLDELGVARAKWV